MIRPCYCLLELWLHLMLLVCALNPSVSQQISRHCVLTQFNNTLACRSGDEFSKWPPPPTQVRSLPIDSICIIDQQQLPWCTADSGELYRWWVQYPWPVLDAITAVNQICFHLINQTIGCVYGDAPSTPADLLSPSLSPWNDTSDGAPFYGWTPTPLQLVSDDGNGTVVGIQQLVSSDSSYFWCTLFTNSSLRCAVSTNLGVGPGVTAFSDWATDRDLALAKFPGVVPIWITAGSMHLCMLYSDGSVVCNGMECLYESCTPPAGMRVSSISCTDFTCCGVRFDGSIVVWGMAAVASMESFYNTPNGIFSQAAVQSATGTGAQLTALVASDASLRSWGTNIDLRTALWDLTASVDPLTAPCALRVGQNPFLTPQIACWSSEAALTMEFLPDEMIFAAFSSVAINPTCSALCVVTAPAHEMHCFGKASEKMLWLPPAFLDSATVQEVRSDTQDFVAWLSDGSLVGWGATNFSGPSYPFQNNPSQYRFSQFASTGESTLSCVLCGILINGTSVCFMEGYAGVSWQSPEAVLQQLNAIRDPHSPALKFTALFPEAYPDLLEVPQISCCGLLSNGSAGCWGGIFFNQTAGNPPLVLVPATSAVTSLVLYDQFDSTTPTGVVCTIVLNGTVDCWSWYRYSSTPNSWVKLYSPQGKFHSIISWYDGTSSLRSMMFATRLEDLSLVTWEPFQSAQFLTRLPSVTLSVATQFYYRPRSGADLPCPPGTFSMGVGAITPLCSGLCAAGRYGASSQNTNIECAGICPTAHYCPAGTDTPIKCPAGTFGATEGLTTSTCSGSCSAGFYCSAGSTNPTLHPCAAGTFSTFSSPIPCQACPVNSYSGATAASCTACPPNSYTAGIGSSTCMNCPTGLNCPGGGVATVARGYWANLSPVMNSTTDNNASLPTTGQVSVFRCPIGYCDGLEGDSGSVILSNPCSIHRSPSYDNVLCGRCDDGYHEWNGACMNCEPLSTRPWLIILLLFLLVLFVVVLHRLTNSSESDSARLAILLFFAQSISLLIQVRMNESILAFIHITNLSPTDTSGGNCLAQLDGTQMITIKFIVPVLAFITLGLVALAQFIWMKCKERQSGSNPSASIPNRDSLHHSLLDEDGPNGSVIASFPSQSLPDAPSFAFPLHAYARTGVTLLLTSYQQWVTLLLQSLQCIHVSTWSVLFSSPSVHCSSSAYALWRIIAGCLVGLLALGPIALAWRAHRARGKDEQVVGVHSVGDSESEKREQEMRRLSRNDAELSSSSVSWSSAGPMAEESSAPVSSAWDQLHLPFRPTTRWWLAVSLLRRVAFIAILLLPTMDSDAQGMGLIYLWLFMLLAHLAVKPYRHEIDNHLETAALVAILSLAVLLSFPRANADSDDTTIQVMSVFIVMPTLILLVGSNVFMAWKQVRERLAAIGAQISQRWNQ